MPPHFYLFKTSSTEGDTSAISSFVEVASNSIFVVDVTLFDVTETSSLTNSTSTTSTGIIDDAIFDESSSLEAGISAGSKWQVFFLFFLVAAGVTGNVLVCIAVGVERKLQNVTNYFLVSLAMADLFVSLIVMPCCIVQEFMGKLLVSILAQEFSWWVIPGIHGWVQ